MTSLEQKLKDACWSDDHDPLEALLPCGYWEEITDDIRSVMDFLLTSRGAYYTRIAEQLRLESKYVHLILEVLAHEGMTEYGTSPRGSWLTDEGEELLAKSHAWLKTKGQDTHDRTHRH